MARRKRAAEDRMVNDMSCSSVSNEMTAMPDLTHLSVDGQANMVDVSDKPVTTRVAVAEGRILMRKSTLDLALSGNAKKGDVFATARIAAIMAAKKTHELIPLCHPLGLTNISVDLEAEPALPGIKVCVAAKVLGQTGAEMEALTGVAIACLTIYDMLKGIDRAMRIEGIELVRKSGGKSGEYLRLPADTHQV
jgi:cyclic pyranopterin monophosphate synthase